jgi:hypothetical protein
MVFPSMMRRACQCIAVLNVARLHFLGRSCCIAAADADQGINRARGPHSFVGVVGVSGIGRNTFRRP